MTTRVIRVNNDDYKLIMQVKRNIELELGFKVKSSYVLNKIIKDNLNK